METTGFHNTMVEIVPRRPSDLENIVKLFHATHLTNGYPVEGPPTDDVSSWPSFFAGSDASGEIAGFTALSLKQVDVKTHSVSTSGTRARASVWAEEQNAQLVTRNASSLSSSGNTRTVLGHASLRRVSEKSIVFELWQKAGGEIDQGLWEICRLAVHPAAQGQGVGKLLMHVAEMKAWKANKPLVLGVLEKDRAAIRMYEDRGWIMFGQDKMTGRDGKVWLEHFYICPSPPKDNHP